MEPQLSEAQQNARVLALNMLTAITMRLKITDRYDFYVRRQVPNPAMPWLELCILKKGKMPTDAELAVVMPESRFILSTKEERSALATNVLTQFTMILGMRDKL